MTKTQMTKSQASAFQIPMEAKRDRVQVQDSERSMTTEEAHQTKTYDQVLTINQNHLSHSKMKMNLEKCSVQKTIMISTRFQISQWDNM